MLGALEGTLERGLEGIFKGWEGGGGRGGSHFRTLEAFRIFGTCREGGVKGGSVCYRAWGSLVV